jgi:hypothetical protein
MPECQSLEALFVRGRRARLFAWAMAWAVELP